MASEIEKKIQYVDVKDLKPISDPPYDLFYITGSKVHDAHEPLTHERIALMLESGIERLVILKGGKTSDDLKRQYQYDKVSFNQLGDGNMVLVKDLYDANGNVVVRQGVKMTRDLIESLNKKTTNLYAKKKNLIYNHNVIKNYRKKVEQLEDLQMKFDRPLVSLDEIKTFTSQDEVSINALEMRIEEGFESTAPSALPLSRRIKNRDSLRPRIQSEIDTYSQLRHSIVDSIDTVFHQVVHENKVSSDHVMSLSTRIINGLIVDKDLLMNLVNVESGDDYLKRHTVNTCIIAIQIATALGFDDSQIVEVAFGALFNDIGMYKVPERIRYKKGRLTPSEWHEVKKHPIYSVDYISKLVGLPKTTPFIAYQVHERLDGSGYPKNRKGHLIHDYARIVAIADVYDALITARTWREGHIPYRAMEELLKECQLNKLDGKILRAFLTSSGLYPVGSWVKLNDGRIAKVVGLAKETAYDRPAVTVIFNKAGGKVDRPQRISLEQRIELKVVEVIDPKELDIENPYSGF